MMSMISAGTEKDSCTVVPVPVSWTEDISALLERRNVGGPHSLVVPSEYLEVVITRK